MRFFSCVYASCRENANSLTSQIRVKLVSLLRCLTHYGNYLDAFSPEADPKPVPLERISYREDQESLELNEEETALDEKRKDVELHPLGTIGFQLNGLKFNQAVLEVEKNSKELCAKLYTGDNVKWLVGNDKIPEYLTIYLEGMKRSAEEFRINSIRDLRETCLELVELCQMIPRAVFGFLEKSRRSVTKSTCSSCVLMCLFR